MDEKRRWDSFMMTEDCEQSFDAFGIGREEYIRRMAEFYDSESMSQMFFWDVDDPDNGTENQCSVGPTTRDDVDWTGFPFEDARSDSDDDAIWERERGGEEE